jgi:CheY-like chemotaxis protein
MGARIGVESKPGAGSTFHFNARFGRASGAVQPLPAGTARSQALFDNWRFANVLLVEDNPVNQKFAVTVLRKAGHAVTLATTGQAALKAAAGQTFDVILMDVQMPLMDGFEATRALRSSGVQTPVIAMTAHTMAGFDEMREQAGMDGYLPKPVPAKKLLETIASVTAKLASGATTQLLETKDPRQLVCIERALTMVGGDRELLKTLARMVLEQIQTDWPIICGHVRAGDSGGLKQAAHRLKGSLGSMGAELAFDACCALEDSANSGVASTHVKALTELEGELERLQPMLREFAAG